MVGAVFLAGCATGRVAETELVAAPSGPATVTAVRTVPTIAPTERPVEVPPEPRPTPAPAVTTTESGTTPSPTTTPRATTAPAASTEAAAPSVTPPAVDAGLDYTFPAQSDSCWYPSSHHDYPAADIFCPIGTPYVAVVGGVVDFVSRQDLYAQGLMDAINKGGLSVAIVGDDGMRYYGSHLSTVADDITPGTRVEVGQLLGLTGDTGNAKGTDPHVHFGISRPTTPDDWQVRRGQVWPQDYLAAWRRGEDVSPAA